MISRQCTGGLAWCPWYPLTSELGSMGVETGDTGETIEPEESLQVRGFPIMERKQAGDVPQSVRTLLSNRHIDVTN